MSSYSSASNLSVDLVCFHKAFLAVHSATSLAELAEALEVHTCQVVGCDEAEFLLLERKNNASRLMNLTGETRKNVPSSEGIAGVAVRDGVDYICEDPAADSYYLRHVDGSGDRDPENIAVTPLRFSDRGFGALLARDLATGFGNASICKLHLMGEHGARACWKLLGIEEGWATARTIARTFGSYFLSMSMRSQRSA